MVMGPCIVEPAVETQNGFARGISPGLNKSNCNRLENECCEIITFPAMCPYGTGILISVASPEMICIKAQRLFPIFLLYLPDIYLTGFCLTDEFRIFLNPNLNIFHCRVLLVESLSFGLSPFTNIQDTRYPAPILLNVVQRWCYVSTSSSF